MRVWVVSIVLMSVTLAGCAGDDPVEAEPAAEPVLVTDPADYAYTENAPAGQEHVHDYWQGQDRAVIMDETRGSGGIILGDGPWPWEVFRPDAPGTVYQGTSEVQVTMSWQDELTDTYGQPQLWVKAADMNASAYVADITSGDTVVMPSTNEANDLPHSLISAWEFHWVIYPSEDAVPPIDMMRYTGDISITVEIVRGLDIPLYPGHPDRWNNQTEILVLDDERSVFYYFGGEPGVTGDCLTGPTGGDCLWDPHVPLNGVVIPFNTDYVTVALTQTEVVGNFVVGFAYHGADTRELTILDPTRTNGNTREFDIEISQEGDGPYNRQSLWEFWAYPDHITDIYSGSYHMTVTAYREP